MSLSVVSCYLVASGIFQIGWSTMIGQYIGNVPALNIVYGVLILFISRGLRRCSRPWYTCALVVTGLVVSGICFEIAQGFIHSVSMRSMFFYFKDFVIWLCIVLVLTRPAIRDLFYHEPDV